MYKEQFALLLLLATLGAIRGFIIPAGKCRIPAVKPIITDVDRIANFHQWQILYASKAYDGIDHEDRQSRVTGLNWYNLTDTRTLTNGTIDVYTFTIENIDAVLYEYYVDQSGTKHTFKIILLDQSPRDDALLYYRCSDDGELDYDTRIIEIPRINKLQDATIHDFLKLDNSYKFVGDIVKLPYKSSSINGSLTSL